MKVKNIVISKSARYFVIGKPGPQIQNVWFVLHGYGQLGGEFLQDFKVLENEYNLLVAPEGLHRFYIHGGTGKVGASWMTQEDRLEDINDYIKYLNQIYSEIIMQINENRAIINVLGFSQGTATASRWTINGIGKVHRLILWGGDFPPDTDWQACRERMKNLKVQLVYGTDDPYIKPIHINKQRKVLQENDICFEIKTFNGSHQINSAMILELAKVI